jgi:hypothetical protein
MEPIGGLGTLNSLFLQRVDLYDPRILHHDVHRAVPDAPQRLQDLFQNLPLAFVGRLRHEMLSQ